MASPAGRRFDHDRLILSFILIPAAAWLFASGLGPLGWFSQGPVLMSDLPPAEHLSPPNRRAFFVTIRHVFVKTRATA